MCLGYPGPGSKNPEPLTEVPVIATSTEALPCGTLDGEAELGVAGGGALSLIARTPQESVALAYSWKVQKGMLSFGLRAIIASNSRSSRASSLVEVPCAGTLSGK